MHMLKSVSLKFCNVPAFYRVGINIPLLKNVIVDLNNKKMGTTTSALGDISTLQCKKLCTVSIVSCLRTHLQKGRPALRCSGLKKE